MKVTMEVGNTTSNHFKPQIHLFHIHKFEHTLMLNGPSYVVKG
jgi:hypothetical protein